MTKYYYIVYEYTTETVIGGKCLTDISPMKWLNANKQILAERGHNGKLVVADFQEVSKSTFDKCNKTVNKYDADAVILSVTSFWAERNLDVGEIDHFIA